MSHIKVGQENSSPIEVYYEDFGSGPPVVLLAGYPFTSTSWEKQTTALVDGGYRVIQPDRRGFGRSSRPSVGYDFNTLAADLNALLSELNLRDVSLVGFSMGTGEIMRYIGRYGTARLRAVVLAGTMGPFWLKTPDNPDGAAAGVFDDMQAAMRADRPATLLNIIKNARNYDVLAGSLVSEQSIQDALSVALSASPMAAVKAIGAWKEDFRADIPKIDVPTLILHAGDTDRILPPRISARPLAKLIRNARLVEIPEAPHDILWTQPERVNKELLEFLVKRK